MVRYKLYIGDRVRDYHTMYICCVISMLLYVMCGYRWYMYDENECN